MFCELEQRWIALHDRAGQIAAMADLAREPMGPLVDRFAEAMMRCDRSAQAAAMQSLDDIETLVDLGLRALKEVEARKQDPDAPALALWREFYHAREAVLAMTLPIAA
jgi:hypothetical protein